jgi:hypothetical protein
MHYLTTARETCRLIFISLYPESVRWLAIDIKNDATCKHYIAYHTIITEKKIPPLLLDLDISRFPSETVRIFFPETCALAAPFLLFRMKRRGFSSSRVTLENGGLLLTATR